MRHPIVAGVVIAALVPLAPALAGGRIIALSVREQRQQSLQMTLTRDSVAAVRGIRTSCAGSKEPQAVARARAAGFVMTPDAADRCTAALIRLGKEGALEYVQDSTGVETPALRFDAGFVTAYRRREAAPASLPAMLALKPLVERCLAGTEADGAHCYSAGYVFGLRAAQGERPVAQ